MPHCRDSWPILRLLAAATLLLNVSCRKAAPAEVTQADPSTQVAYPRGTWRLARERLDDVVLHVSHILIAHSASTRHEWGLPLQDDLPARAQGRDRTEAAALAARLAKELATAKSSFERIAREQSDDLATAPLGGSLGNVAASQLPDPLLDALATMKAGDVSRVVETQLGFHILKRLAVQPETRISAREIVISYQGIPQTLARPGRTIARTRDEALAIARDAASRARSKPDSFPDLVNELSDYHTALRGGDIGAFSTHEPGEMSRELEALAPLPIGGVTDPIDSGVGFRVLQRTDRLVRQRLAMTEVLLRYDLTAGAAPDATKDNARQRAMQAADELRKNPGRFEELQRRFCCADRIHNLSEGRWIAGLAEALTGVEIGQLTSVVETPIGFHIMKRLDPAILPSAPRHIVFDIPTPSRVDIDHIVANAQPAALARSVRDLREKAPLVLNLDEKTGQRFAEILGGLAETFEVGIPEQRLVAMGGARASLAELLGSDRFNQYEDFVQQQVAAQLMSY